MRTVKMTIRQTEHFEVFVAIPDEATFSDIEALAEKVLGADDVLDASNEVGDCNIEMRSITEVQLPYNENQYVYVERGNYLDVFEGE